MKQSSPSTILEERPVSVSADCARSILGGRKTMLRQVALDPSAPCPLGVPGGLLWVREPWMPAPSSGFLYCGAHPPVRAASWLPARDMPRHASRIRLQITALRLERLQEISDSDLELEGALWRQQPLVSPAPSDRAGFARWWDSLHPRAATQWAENPLVWVVNFAVL
jgi:hypothetical protein